MARADRYTHLALDRYAAIMGIAPAHFNGAFLGSKFPYSACGSIWKQHNWQAGDRVGRDELADAIWNAEDDIRRTIGYPVAPEWVSQEVQQYPRHWRREVYNSNRLDVRGQFISLRANWGKIIAPGVRIVSLIASPAVTYQDLDGDGLNETAVVTCATDVTDECEVKVYFHDHSGDPAWEVRPCRAKRIVAGVFTATFWAWQLINPVLWEELPDTETPNQAVDSSLVAGLVTEVDVYRECNDTTAVSAEFYWSRRREESYSTCDYCGGVGCQICQYQIQDGCLSIIDAENGIVIPQPGQYDSGTGGFSSQSWESCRDPDFVKLWYYCGGYAEGYLSGYDCEHLSQDFAQAIAWLATSRLDRPLCACSNVESIASSLQQELTESGQGKALYLPQLLAENPFGTKRGEVMAWRKIARFAVKVPSVGVI